LWLLFVCICVQLCYLKMSEEKKEFGIYWEGRLIVTYSENDNLFIPYHL